MRINQRQMEIFNAIMVYKSVTAAATSLRTSQPTVSRELRDLERQIGFDLFNRFGKRLTPTNQAQLLYSVVARSFVGMEEISRVAIAIRGHDGAYLRIACIPAYAEALMPVVVRRFLDLRPRVLLSVHSLEEVPLRHDLTTQMFDVGLTEGSYEHDETTEKVDIGELLCVLPTGHRLVEKKIIEPSDFEGVEFVYFSQEDPYRRKLDDIFDAEGISRRYSVETTTATGVCSMVAAGVGVSIVNPFTAAHYCKKGVVLRRLSVRVPYQVTLWRPAEGLRSTHADLFVKVLHEVTATVQQQLKAQLEE
ncbi:LysR family transcriptional regulator [Sinorhizobium meliloti]|uniref:LysR family transcriptional regulator n=1 Tax=Rhizobium meliloti TaxID=382 RepID=UPI00020F3CB1|nr:LysR family transcriptional regulator [Sinorhizobium meliloti]AEG58034.1 transcriptional regulator, LysR family [Sinorhizobium meliloti AK83]MDE4588991.1 LysR family transcriptional regulator [Sinorhizobium meliloti]SEJ82514.1 DNA-binding transcriptional regulator, LysR family [Sinorhizobium meliloti]